MSLAFLRHSVGAKIALATSVALAFVTSLFIVIFFLLDVNLLSKFTLIQLIVAFVILLLFVEVLLILVAANIFVQRPLQKLSDAMKVAEDGNFSVRSKEESRDELGEIAHSFNRMMAKITDLDAHKIETEREYKISQALAHTLEISELIHAVSHTLSETLRLKEFVFFLFNKSEEVLEVRSVHGFGEDSRIRSMIVKPGEGVIGRTVTQKKTIYIEDAQSESDIFHRGSFVSIPLIVGDGRVLGVLSVGDPEKWAFSDNDIKFFESLADQIAIAYHRSKLYTKTKELSVTDELTGVYNRRHFQQVLRMEWKRAERFNRSFSLLMVDADHFKEYNDTFGHLKGDIALKELARLLMSNVREVDTVARFGGEEFVIILANTKLEEALIAGEKLRELVERYAPSIKHHGSKKTHAVTVSIGVSAYPDLAKTEDELINTADVALYRAKAQGRNRVVKFEAPIELKRSG